MTEEKEVLIDVHECPHSNPNERDVYCAMKQDHPNWMLMIDILPIGGIRIDVLFCPFCGTKLQDEFAVTDKES